MQALEIFRGPVSPQWSARKGGCLMPSARVSSILDLDIAFLDHLAPFGDLRLYEFSELGRSG